MELAFEEWCSDEFLKKLRQYPRVRHLGNAGEHNWGQRVIRSYDLDGHLIEVAAEMKSAASRFLAAGMSMEEAAGRIGTSAEDVVKLLQMD